MKWNLKFMFIVYIVAGLKLIVPFCKQIFLKYFENLNLANFFKNMQKHVYSKTASYQLHHISIK